MMSRALFTLLAVLPIVVFASPRGRLAARAPASPVNTTSSSVPESYDPEKATL